MTEATAGSRAAAVYQWVLLAGLLAMLAANLPGHLSYDSVVQLFEGRTGERRTWAPAVLSWLLGRFDRVVPGTGLYVTTSAALLTASLASLASLRPRASWLAVPVALAAVLTPQFMVYQAIVWKDVLFANLAVAGFICLAHAAARWPRRAARALALGLALVFLATATLVRQNGVIAVVFAALALAWTARRRGWRAAGAWGIGGLAATLLLAQVIGVAVQPRAAPMSADADRGVRVLQHYDIVGAAAQDSAQRLEVIAAASPQARDVILAEGRRVYSAERVDNFGASPTLGPALWKLPSQVVAAQWRAIVFGDAPAYVKHRLAAFRQVLLTPRLDRCLAVHVGVEGSAGMLATLAIAPVQEPQDKAMHAYAARFYATPVYSHLTYAVLALVFGAVLLVRGRPADVAMAGLLGAALAFAASFLAISVACDYRYLYVLDLAAMTGALYLSLDPKSGRERKAGAA